MCLAETVDIRLEKNPENLVAQHRCHKESEEVDWAHA